MKALLAVGALLALVASVLVLRIVLHAYSGHGHLDLFHLAVGAALAAASLLLARRSLRRRP